MLPHLSQVLDISNTGDTAAIEDGLHIISDSRDESLYLTRDWILCKRCAASTC